MERQRALTVSAEFGLTQAWLDSLRQMSPPKAAKALEAFNRARFRKLALKYHPDRNPGNSEAEARFRLLTPILDRIQSMQMRVQKSQPAPEASQSPAQPKFQRTQWNAPPMRYTPATVQGRLNGGYFGHVRQSYAQGGDLEAHQMLFVEDV